MTHTNKPGDPADKAADGAFGGVTSHRAGYGDRLARVEEWLRKHPSATLASGEGTALLEEIDRLRAAIERVRALHRHDEPCDVECSTWHDTTFCPTIRALDGEGA
jgi:hypothetical protein